MCGLKTRSHLINAHLDVCLNEPLSPTTLTQPNSNDRASFPTQTQTASSTTQEDGGASSSSLRLATQGVQYQCRGSLPRLPKLVFSVMTDKQLRKKAKEYELSTQGQRSSLIARLKEFTLQYAAQRDALRPKSGGGGGRERGRER